MDVAVVAFTGGRPAGCLTLETAAGPLAPAKVGVVFVAVAGSAEDLSGAGVLRCFHQPCSWSAAGALGLERGWPSTAMLAMKLSSASLRWVCSLLASNSTSCPLPR